MFRFTVSLVPAALAMVSMGSSAYAQQNAGAASGPLTFDVAGVRLEASPDEVKAALKRAGYVIDYVGTAETLQQEAQFEADQRLGRKVRWVSNAGVSTIHAHGAHQENAIIDFVQQPRGSAVSSVAVQVPGSAMSQAAFRSQVLDKYGKPDASRFEGSEMVWCAAEAREVCGKSYVPSGHLDSDYPRLSISASPNGGNINLEIGQLAFDQAQRDKEAAIEGMAPKTSHGAF